MHQVKHPAGSSVKQPGRGQLPFTLDTKLCGCRNLEWVRSAKVSSQSPYCPSCCAYTLSHPLTRPLALYLPPPTLLLLLCQGALLFAGYCWRIFETRCSVLTLVHCTATMVHSSGSSICRLFLLVLLGLFIAFIHTGKAVDSIRQLMLKQVTVRFY